MKNKEQFGEKLAQLAAQFVSLNSNRTSLITVTRALINERKTVCTIYFSVFPEKDEQNALIFMKRSAGDLKLFMREKGNVIRAPHIEMEIDAGDKHRRKIEEVAKTIPLPSTQA
jgi:ribosome-binding factor A